MNYMQIMQHNLAQLLNQQQSLPQLLQSQPTDPFQKRQFGKKMRKSAINITNQPPTTQHYHSNQVEYKQENVDTLRPFAQLMSINHKKHFKSEQQPQLEQRMRQVSLLFEKLKTNLSGLQGQYRDKVYKIYKTGGNKRNHQINELLGNLEGSVEFIIKNCLNLEESQDSHTCNKEENYYIYNREQKRRRVDSDKQNMRMNNQAMQRPKKREIQQKNNDKQKSVYEAVLQQRQRRAKKKMI